MPGKSVVDLLIQEAEHRLAAYRRQYKDGSWREKVLLLVELTGTVKDLGIHTDVEAAKVSARERLRLYLVSYVGEVLTAPELEVVSGISEYGRRVRELRTQDGYKILTGASNDPEVGVTLRQTDYLLLDSEPDKTAAQRWHVANRIRRQEQGGSMGRILRYLRENVGEVITSEELFYVARASEFGRRTRELRTEQGYPIATRFTGRPDLRMGEYVQKSRERIAEPHDRRTPFAVEKEVYARDDNTCRLCGWNRSRWNRRDPRILELHHVREHARGGANTADNLLVLCSRCHDDIHAGRRSLPADILG